MPFTKKNSKSGAIKVTPRSCEPLRRWNAAPAQKLGLLVESIEGAETIKSGQGGWRMLGRWLANVDEARDAELQSRNLSEHFQHLISSFQQMSYVLLVAFGAWLVTQGSLTQGGLIACTILSGRVLSPVAAVAAQALLHLGQLRVAHEDDARAPLRQQVLRNLIDETLQIQAAKASKSFCRRSGTDTLSCHTSTHFIFLVFYVKLRSNSGTRHNGHVADEYI